MMKVRKRLKVIAKAFFMSETEENTFLSLKEPDPIASIVFQTFTDFGIRKLIFFSLPLMNFTAQECTVWKILMKM